MSSNVNNECCICLAPIDTSLPINAANRIYVTQCGHRFHFMCLFRWCSINNSCPTCRSPSIFSFTRDNTSNNLNVNTINLNRSNLYDVLYNYLSNRILNNNNDNNNDNNNVNNYANYNVNDNYNYNVNDNYNANDNLNNNTINDRVYINGINSNVRNYINTIINNIDTTADILLENNFENFNL